MGAVTQRVGGDRVGGQAPWLSRQVARRKVAENRRGRLFFLRGPRAHPRSFRKNAEDASALTTHNRFGKSGPWAKGQLRPREFLVPRRTFVRAAVDLGHDVRSPAPKAIASVRRGPLAPPHERLWSKVPASAASRRQPRGAVLRAAFAPREQRRRAEAASRRMAGGQEPGNRDGVDAASDRLGRGARRAGRGRRGGDGVSGRVARRVAGSILDSVRHSLAARTSRQIRCSSARP
jgi:hypothetical protein